MTPDQEVGHFIVEQSQEILRLRNALAQSGKDNLAIEDELERARAALSELLQAAKAVLSTETSVGWVLSLRGDPEVATLRTIIEKVEKARKVVEE